MACRSWLCIGVQMEMEQALLQAERQAEQEQVEAENEIISQLQLRLSQLEKATQKEKDKVGTKEKNCVMQLILSVCTKPLHVNVPVLESLKPPSRMQSGNTINTVKWASTDLHCLCISCLSENTKLSLYHLKLRSLSTLDLIILKKITWCETTVECWFRDTHHFLFFCQMCEAFQQLTLLPIQPPLKSSNTLTASSW